MTITIKSTLKEKLTIRDTEVLSLHNLKHSSQEIYKEFIVQWLHSWIDQRCRDFMLRIDILLPETLHNETLDTIQGLIQNFVDYLYAWNILYDSKYWCTTSEKNNSMTKIQSILQKPNMNYWGEKIETNLVSYERIDKKHAKKITRHLLCICWDLIEETNQAFVGDMIRHRWRYYFKKEEDFLSFLKEHYSFRENTNNWTNQEKQYDEFMSWKTPESKEERDALRLQFDKEIPKTVFWNLIPNENYWEDFSTICKEFVWKSNSYVWKKMNLFGNVWFLIAAYLSKELSEHQKKYKSTYINRQLRTILEIHKESIFKWIERKIFAKQLLYEITNIFWTYIWEKKSEFEKEPLITDFYGSLWAWPEIIQRKQDHELCEALFLEKLKSELETSSIEELKASRKARESITEHWSENDLVIYNYLKQIPIYTKLKKDDQTTLFYQSKKKFLKIKSIVNNRELNTKQRANLLHKRVSSEYKELDFLKIKPIHFFSNQIKHIANIVIPNNKNQTHTIRIAFIIFYSTVLIRKDSSHEQDYFNEIAKKYGITQETIDECIKNCKKNNVKQEISSFYRYIKHISNFTKDTAESNIKNLIQLISHWQDYLENNNNKKNKTINWLRLKQQENIWNILHLDEEILLYDLKKKKEKTWANKESKQTSNQKTNSNFIKKKIDVAYQELLESIALISQENYQNFEQFIQTLETFNLPKQLITKCIDHKIIFSKDILETKEPIDMKHLREINNELRFIRMCSWDLGDVAIFIQEFLLCDSWEPQLEDNSRVTRAKKRQDVLNDRVKKWRTTNIITGYLFQHKKLRKKRYNKYKNFFWREYWITTPEDISIGKEMIIDIMETWAFHYVIDTIHEKIEAIKKKAIRNMGKEYKKWIGINKFIDQVSLFQMNKYIKTIINFWDKQHPHTRMLWKENYEKRKKTSKKIEWKREKIHPEKYTRYIES